MGWIENIQVKYKYLKTVPEHSTWVIGDTSFVNPVFWMLQTEPH